MRNFSRTCFVSMLGLAIGCGEPSVSGDDDPNGDPDAQEANCVDDNQCTGDTPYCVQNNCAECRTSADCPTDAPVCGNGQCTASCAGDEVNASFVSLPSDIIWIVDQSGSMNQETQYVQAKINDFANAINASAIDYRVVMIARSSGTNAICVPAPLSNGTCGNNTRFRLVNQVIGSNDGPQKMLDQYNNYADFLRPEAMKHIVFVTDDNSNLSAVNFKNGLAAKMPTGIFDNYKVHAIYSYPGRCSGNFGSGAADGTVYTTLVTDTGGARGVICNDDWTTVFNDIQAAVVSGSQVACELEMPEPQNGQTLDPTKVNVKYLAGGVAPGTTLSQVPDAAACTAAGGWYYDNNTTPTKITLCPSTCTTIQADANASVKVELGCSTQIF
jgi:hypothetical protein